jgi:hypothetical protein
MKVPRLDRAYGSGFFGGFAFGGLAVREMSLRRSFGKGPLISAVGVHQQELHDRTPPAVTDCSDLQRE